LEADVTIDELRGIVSKVVLYDSAGIPKRHRFRVDYFEGSEVMFVQHQFWRLDSKTGEGGYGHGRKWHISSHSTESEVVLTCLKAAITDAEHEVREGFRYKGVAIVHPHPDVNVLATVAVEEEVRA
jgi:hypothetical protein